MARRFGIGLSAPALAILVSIATVAWAQSDAEPDPTRMFDLLRTCVDQAAEPEEVIPACSEIFEIMPLSATQEASMRFNRGEAHFALKDYDSAITDYAEAVALDASQVPYALRLATGLRVTGAYEPALNVLAPVMETGIDQDLVLLERGRVYLAMGDADRAYADFNAAEAINSGSLDVYRAKAQVYRETGTAEQAEDAYTQGVMIGRTNPEAYLARGQFYLDSGNYLEAMKDGYRAVSLGDRRPEILRIRGIGYMMIEESVQASTDIMDALKTAEPTWVDTVRTALAEAGIALPLDLETDAAVAAIDAAIALKDPALFPMMD